MELIVDIVFDFITQLYQQRVLSPLKVGTIGFPISQMTADIVCCPC